MKDRPNKTITRLFIFCSTVGYQSIETASATKLMTTTFIKVDGTTKTLGDYIPQSTADKKNWGPANFYLNFYSTAGKQRKVKDDLEIARLYPAAIIDPAVSNNVVQFYYEKRKDKPEGWYLTTDSSYNYPMAGYQIEDGAGFLMMVSSKMGTLTLTFSGQVDTEDLPLSINGATILTGNVTPTPITLGEIVVTSAADKKNWGPANFYLNFYNAAGKQMKVYECAEIARLYSAAIADPAVCNNVVQFYYEKRKDKPEGWYLTTDAGYSYPMAKFVIGAGEGFLLMSSSKMGNVTVTLPGVDLK